jgi:uncharacterized membrane protein YfcA
MQLDALFGLAALAAFLVGSSKGGLPAVGMLAVPVLSLRMSPVLAAGLLLPIFVVSDVAGLWLYRRSYSAANVRILVPAGMAGRGPACTPRIAKSCSFFPAQSRMRCRPRPSRQ